MSLADRIDSHPEVSDLKCRNKRNPYLGEGERFHWELGPLARPAIWRVQHRHRTLTDERGQEAAVQNSQYHHRGRILQLELDHRANIQNRENTHSASGFLSFRGMTSLSFVRSVGMRCLQSRKVRQSDARQRARQANLAEPRRRCF